MSAATGGAVHGPERLREGLGCWAEGRGMLRCCGSSPATVPGPTHVCRERTHQGCHRLSLVPGKPPAVPPSLSQGRHRCSSRRAPLQHPAASGR